MFRLPDPIRHVPARELLATLENTINADLYGPVHALLQATRLELIKVLNKKKRIVVEAGYNSHYIYPDLSGRFNRLGEIVGDVNQYHLMDSFYELLQEANSISTARVTALLLQLKNLRTKDAERLVKSMKGKSELKGQSLNAFIAELQEIPDFRSLYHLYAHAHDVNASTMTHLFLCLTDVLQPLPSYYPLTQAAQAGIRNALIILFEGLRRAGFFPAQSVETSLEVIVAFAQVFDKTEWHILRLEPDMIQAIHNSPQHMDALAPAAGLAQEIKFLYQKLLVETLQKNASLTASVEVLKELAQLVDQSVLPHFLCQAPAFIRALYASPALMSSLLTVPGLQKEIESLYEKLFPSASIVATIIATPFNMFKSLSKMTFVIPPLMTTLNSTTDESNEHEEPVNNSDYDPTKTVGI